MKEKDLKIAIIGLGYVGLPLAVEFGKIRSVIGYDINEKRINEPKSGIDLTNETSEKDLSDSKQLYYTSDDKDLSESNYYIIAVPTPVDKYKRPKLKALIQASKTVGKVLKPGI